ncbi:nebulette isoform X2 [Esox lucius]|uniref:nebulette isoform X2 n=1 Tax=Esox lucius TaxID=8010 RepID=UPI0014768569|nr:nebulette isoform X2 [Esox lucius]
MQRIFSQRLRVSPARLRHYPKQSFTIVADTPENLRLRQQSELQSQVKYKKDFEASKGRGFKFVLDTPELQRLRRAQDQISNVKYHKDFEVTGSPGVTQGVYEPYPVRGQLRRNGQTEHQGVHQYIVEDRGPGVIVAPVLPGACYTSGHVGANCYMHQTNMHSLRPLQGGPRSGVASVYRALYDYASQDTDEVSFRDGDIIQNVQPIDGGWVYGTVRRTGRSGMLPGNYIEGLR